MYTSCRRINTLLHLASGILYTKPIQLACLIQCIRLSTGHKWTNEWSGVHHRLHTQSHHTAMLLIWCKFEYIQATFCILYFFCTQTNSNTLSPFPLSCGFYCITLFACHELLTNSHHVLAQEGKEEDDQLGEEAWNWSQWSCVCHRMCILT